MKEIHKAGAKPKKPIKSNNLLAGVQTSICDWLTKGIAYIAGIVRPYILLRSDTNKSEGEEETCTCVHYTVPITCWPRIQKSQPLIRNLSERCSYIFKHTSGWQKEPIKDLKKIDIYIDSNVQTDVRQLLVRVNTFEKKETVSRHVYERNMPSFSLHANFSGIFIDKEGVRSVENVTLERIDVLTVDLAGDDSIRTEPQYFDTTQTKCEINSLLECVVFENLTLQYKQLKRIFKNLTKPFTQETSSSSLKEICKNDEAYDFLMTQRSTIEQLLGEMTTMFKRSTLPKHKIPHLFGFEKQQVTRQLFCFDETIRACGYSNNTFNVNLVSFSNEEDDTDRKRRIKDFLAKFNVTNVKFNTVSKDVSEYRYVGAEVIAKKNLKGTEVTHQATIGGFASMEQEESTCVLISRHLGMGCKESKVYVDSNGHPVEFGKIVEGTLDEGGYDIAAAKVLDHHASACDVRYKNSDDVPLPGILKSDLENLPVHLWGAKSKPGFGIITIPDLHPSDKNGSYMQIEDREPPVKGQAVQRMAVEGDSGAVICADDLDDENVNVIAMLIGSNNADVTKDSPAAKGTYVAFPLQKGVELLQRKTNRTFSLKGVSNNWKKKSD